MKKRHLLLTSSIALTILIRTGEAWGGGGFSGGATEWTQIANNIELAAATSNQLEQLARQASQVENELRMLQGYDKGEWGNTVSDLATLSAIVRQGQAISYALQHVDTAFKSQYPGYRPPQNYTMEYQHLSDNTLDSIKGSLMAAGFQSTQFGTEEATMQTLRNMSNDAVGQTQAVQVGNMISGQVVGQLQKMRQLQMAQMQAQNTYMAQEVQRKADGDAALDRFIQPHTVQEPGRKLRASW